MKAMRVSWSLILQVAFSDLAMASCCSEMHYVIVRNHHPAYIERISNHSWDAHSLRGSSSLPVADQNGRTWSYKNRHSSTLIRSPSRLLSASSFVLLLESSWTVLLVHEFGQVEMFHLHALVGT